jgi:hypothetical protein
VQRRADTVRDLGRAGAYKARGKLVEIRLADDDGACGLERGNDRRVLRRLIRECRTRRRRGQARDIELSLIAHSAPKTGCPSACTGSAASRPSSSTARSRNAAAGTVDIHPGRPRFSAGRASQCSTISDGRKMPGAVRVVKR